MTAWTWNRSCAAAVRQNASLSPRTYKLLAWHNWIYMLLCILSRSVLRDDLVGEWLEATSGSLQHEGILPTAHAVHHMYVVIAQQQHLPLTDKMQYFYRHYMLQLMFNRQTSMPKPTTSVRTAIRFQLLIQPPKTNTATMTQSTIKVRFLQLLW